MEKVKKQKKEKIKIYKGKKKKTRIHLTKPEHYEDSLKTKIIPVPSVQKKESKQKSFWIFILILLIIVVVIVLLIKFKPRLKISVETKSLSAEKSSVVTPASQQTVQEKIIPENTIAPITRGNTEYRQITICFPINKWEVTWLSSEEKEKLKKFIDELSNNKSLQQLSVFGYADRTGMRSYNLLVSEKRAGNVAEFISQSTGFSLDKIIIKGKGEVLEGPDGKENPLFRKVEIIMK
jgi:outer membrane protein OmpA-like peptidoglycan-associated protein